MAKANSTRTIDSTIGLEEIRAIRKALVIGLSSFGEIERLGNACAFHSDVPEDLHPLHPTGNADTVGDFADALAYVGHLEDERIQSLEGGAA